MNILIANFGNDSIGLIHYAYRQNLSNVSVISIDTGWGNPAWDQRVDDAEAWINSLGFTSIRLQAKLKFAELILAQREFPSTKFQWCAPFLKGDTIRAYLSEIDPLKQARILLARRRSQSPKFATLPEWIENAEEFDGYAVWHPLYLFSEADVRAEIDHSPFAWIPHRSLECDPCVNSDINDIKRLSPDLIQRLTDLEMHINEPFLPQLYAGRQTLRDALPYLQSEEESGFLFDMGCGSPYGCGL